MKAIETHYRGYRFRSRLEARWAVIFDFLKIRWEYELEGYEWTEGLDSEAPPEVGAEKFMYLPDFYLPEQCVHAEVKGDPTVEDIRMLASAAVPHWGLPDKRTDTSRLGDRILILGRMPDKECAPSGVMLYWWKGCVFWYPWTPEQWQNVGATTFDSVFGDNGDFEPTEARKIIDHLNNWVYPTKNNAMRIAASLGRCARFEHGESP